MDMDSDEMHLKEWEPLSDLLNKLPAKIQLFHDVNMTCVDVLENFIAIGTNTGIVFWYNRIKGDLQKLRSEFTSPIKCIKIISTVEYMVAAGSTCGQMSVFQIQKEHPPDLNLEPLTKAKPIERYTIRDLHLSTITCVEWSKNGMKLFSGDKLGIIVLTEFDYQAHVSKSIEIFNEAYEIVQICFRQPWLLISTVYRTVICERDINLKWKVSQIGKKDRKTLSDFGATFNLNDTKIPSIICCRPGFRFWIADVHGNVLHTLLFKDTVFKTNVDVPLLNPGRVPIQLPKNFGRVYLYKDDYIVTYSQNVMYILNMTKLSIEAVVKKLRGILDISICGSEIFILEGARSLLRISTEPEKFPIKNANILHFHPTTSLERSPSHLVPIEIEADVESVISAEECFELPPIEHLELPISLNHSYENGDDQMKLFLEHSKKVEVFDKINSLTYEDSILFKSKKQKSTQKQKKKHKSGIVEIGQQPCAEDEITCFNTETLQPRTSNSKPSMLEVSFCDSSGLCPDLRSPETIKRELEPKEKILAETLNIESVKLEKLETPTSTESSLEHLLPCTWQYSKSTIADMINNSSPLKKIHFINDDPTSPSKADDSDFNAFTNLSDDLKSVINQSCDYDINSQQNANLHLPSTSAREGNKNENIAVPEVHKMPEHLNIPNLWNVRITNIDQETNGRNSNENKAEGADNCDWEIVDM